VLGRYRSDAHLLTANARQKWLFFNPLIIKELNDSADALLLYMFTTNGFKNPFLSDMKGGLETKKRCFFKELGLTVRRVCRYFAHEVVSSGMTS
jgi:hypothetical protein